MTWGFTAQRRAEEFDAYVEGASTPGAADTRTTELLELVGALRATPEVSARPEFVASLRERLMAEAATALVPDDLSRLALPQRRPTRERRVAAVVGSLAIVGATTSLAVASQSALPGDSLYPIKRAIEQAHTGLSVGEGSKGSTMLASASDRLEEVDALTRQDDLGDEARIAETLNAFTDQATKASDLLLADYTHSGSTSSIARLRDFASASLAQLAALEPLVPADARDELIRAAGVLTTIDTEAALRCPDCGGAGIASIPPVLAAGETINVPQPKPSPSAEGERGHQGGNHGGKRGGDTSLPEVDPEDVGPGSVNPGGGSVPGTTNTGGSNPLQDLTDGLTGGLTGGSPTGAPSIPVVTDVVKGVTGILEGVVEGLTDPLLPESP
jgi:hypothetical protein